MDYLTTALINWSVVYIPLAIGVGVIGSYRKIGFTISLLCALFFTPIIGLVIVLLSKKK